MNIDSQAIQDLGLARRPASNPAASNELGQGDFFRLLTTQLSHQNPLDPVDNKEFMSQIAQFGTLQGVQDLGTAFSRLASAITSDKGLQAAQLVGRQVLLDGSEALLPAGGELTGQVDLPAGASGITVKILDAGGQLLRTIDLGNEPGGQVPFAWDGMRDDGALADPGRYQVQAEGIVDGENVALTTRIATRVESVALGGGGVEVNLSGLGSVRFDQIRQIL